MADLRVTNAPRPRLRRARRARQPLAPAGQPPRVVIEGVRPEIDGGRFPIKRVVHETVVVEADCFADGHDELACLLRYRPAGASAWIEVPMRALGNDRWRGAFTVTTMGRYHYTCESWVDPFTSWRRDLAKRLEAGQDVNVELLTGAALVEAARRRAPASAARQFADWVRRLRGAGESAARGRLALAETLAQLMAAYPDRRHATTYEPTLEVVVDRERARFSTWYELFPRSCAAVQGRHGTFADVQARLPAIAAMGFDVLYLPPIHPIGRTHRKGKNNATVAGPDDPGSPWAIGAVEGGHTAVHPRLGTLQAFRRLVAAAKAQGLEVALDLALQCAPDHPAVRQHPEWFRRRPDGTVQFAENPPKKYEDIYPFDFDTTAWASLWQECHRIVRFWIDQGVRIFRVDNPHTKPFALWERLIRDIKRETPEALFLAEAFTRPKVMYRLAKAGFTQSYTYFTWRNTKEELTQYFTELTQTEVREFFRPNLWPNTPDILHAYLQTGGRPAFAARLVLAATLGASYGIYGPAFERCERIPRQPGSEEYLNAEKYELKSWGPDPADSLTPLLTRINRIRREQSALQHDRTLRFHPTDNDQLLCYSKSTADLRQVMLAVVNLDPHHTQAGWVDLRLDTLGLDSGAAYEVHDLLNEARYRWQGSRNYVALDPHVTPAHIFRVR